MTVLSRRYSRIDSDTTSHISILALSRAEVLHVFQSRCLIVACTKSTLGGGGRKSRRNSRQSSGCTQIDSDGCLDVSALFISTVKLRFGTLKLQKG